MFAGKPSGDGYDTLGMSADEKRQAAAEAAERRMKVISLLTGRQETRNRIQANQGRGLGSSEKATQLTEAAKKQELIGRIREYYAVSYATRFHYVRILISCQARRLDPPLGLNLASVDQLRKHLDLLKSGKVDPSSAVLDRSL